MPELVRSGVRLHYDDEGEGPPLCFHTGGAGDGLMWKDAGYLSALPRRRHLLHDHRGHGQSDKPQAPEAHQLEEYIKDLIAVLDAAEVQQATLVSYSDAANVVFAIAARYPARVSAIVHIGGFDHPDEDVEGRRQVAADARKMGLRAWLEEMAAHEDEPPPEWLMNNLCATSTEMFALELEAWADAPDPCAYLPEITAPTLIVWGEKENSDGAAELAVQSLRDGAMHVVPRFGHLQAFWSSDATAPVIAEFLEQHDPASI